LPRRVRKSFRVQCSCNVPVGVAHLDHAHHPLDEWSPFGIWDTTSDGTPVLNVMFELVAVHQRAERPAALELAALSRLGCVGLALGVLGVALADQDGADGVLWGWSCLGRCGAGRPRVASRRRPRLGGQRSVRRRVLGGRCAAPKARRGRAVQRVRWRALSHGDSVASVALPAERFSSSYSPATSRPPSHSTAARQSASWVVMEPRSSSVDFAALEDKRGWSPSCC
jgi:hypothetical protein